MSNKGETTEAMGGLRAEHHVRLRTELLVGWHDNTGRTDRWSGPHYAARNPHWCGRSDCSCTWIVWPAEFPDDWVCVDNAMVEFIEEVAA